jgi:hypothetical protein
MGGRGKKRRTEKNNRFLVVVVYYLSHEATRLDLTRLGSKDVKKKILHTNEQQQTSHPHQGLGFAKTQQKRG